jgi:hypothetical protein
MPLQLFQLQQNHTKLTNYYESGPIPLHSLNRCHFNPAQPLPPFGCCPGGLFVRQNVRR